MRKPKKRQCSVCGEVKPLSEFYTYKYKGRKYTRGFCNTCDLRRRERYKEKHPGGLTYDKDTGKLWLRNGRGRSLVWTSQMLSDLRRLFARTKNKKKMDYGIQDAEGSVAEGASEGDCCGGLGGWLCAMH